MTVYTFVMSFENYPIFRVKAFHSHVIQGLACMDECATALHHCHIVAVVIVVPSDIVPGVTAAHYDCFLTFGILLRFRELRRMDQTVALEIIESGDVGRHVRLSGMACSQDYMAWVKGACVAH